LKSSCNKSSFDKLPACKQWNFLPKKRLSLNISVIAEAKADKQERFPFYFTNTKYGLEN
jgi:hypothetical protein